MTVVLNRVNEIKESKRFGIMKILEYNNCNDIKIQFIKTGAIVNTTYRKFKNDNIKDPLCKNVVGIGCFGIGKYKSTNKGKITKEYGIWNHMLDRSIVDLNNSNARNKSYADVIICESWLNFQNFANWFEKNYYEIPNTIMHLDKDILIKNNKIYGPEFCEFVPANINYLFTKSNAIRGKCSIGTYFNKTTNKYVARIRIDSKTMNIGTFNTQIEAFNAYKKIKEENIKQMADKYKIYLPTRIYKALYNYNVEITD